MKKTLVFIVIAASLAIVGCSSLQLQPADFSWAAEEIVDIGAKGMVDAKRYSVAFNVTALLTKEFAADSMAAKNTQEVRLIRDKAGFYYLTGKKFKNVYVLAQSDGALAVSNTLAISAEKAMDDPKFDQKDTYIELWNGKDKYQLSKGGAQPLGGKK
ncbi:MAG: hypothetical protein WCX28_08075 [Bacteriovoracaceae bacterium]|nr:hypothetical protein [Bacteroidota bacterium]